jgi:hypothetical protein
VLEYGRAILLQVLVVDDGAAHLTSSKEELKIVL